MSGDNFPALVGKSKQDDGGDFSSEREILYKILFDMRADINELKKITANLSGGVVDRTEEVDVEPRGLANENTAILSLPENRKPNLVDDYDFAEEIQEEETLSLHEKEIELIKKSLERNSGRRKAAAEELGISERTLYRKIKQYDL